MPFNKSKKLSMKEKLKSKSKTKSKVNPKQGKNRSLKVKVKVEDESQYGWPSLPFFHLEDRELLEKLLTDMIPERKPSNISLLKSSTLDKQSLSKVDSAETLVHAEPMDSMQMDLGKETGEIEVAVESEEFESEEAEVQIVSIDEDEKVEVIAIRLPPTDDDDGGWTLVVNTINRHNSKRNRGYTDNPPYHSYYSC